jgi:hypothetical protein
VKIVRERRGEERERGKGQGRTGILRGRTVRRRDGGTDRQRRERG